MRYIVYVSVNGLYVGQEAAAIERVKASFEGFFSDTDKVAYVPTRGDNVRTHVEVLP